MLFRALKRKPDAMRGAPRARHAAEVFMPVKTGDVEVLEAFAGPLRARLIASSLGDVVGYKLRPGRDDEPAGIEIHLVLATAHPRGLQTVGQMLEDMDAPVGSTIHFAETGQRHLFGRTEGLAIDLDRGTNWLDFAEAAIEMLGGSAIYQGSREIAGRRRLYFYGENATSIATTIRAASQLDPRIGEVRTTRLT